MSRILHLLCKARLVGTDSSWVVATTTAIFQPPRTRSLLLSIFPAVHRSSLSLSVRHFGDGGGDDSSIKFDEQTVYIHPLSQLVLAHLTSKGDWIQRQGLQQGLKINPDGTFTLRYRSTPLAPRKEQENKIWTSFDSETKTHWLTVHKGDLVGRFLLQDNLKPAWNDGKSTPGRIQQAVDAMMEKVDENDQT